MRYLLALLAFAAACSTNGEAADAGTDGATSPYFAMQRMYQHDVYSPTDCPAIQAAHPGTNCSQFGTFATDGTLTILFTDVMNLGTYEIVGDELTVNISSPSGEGPTQKFKLATDQSSMTWEADQSVWKLVSN